jgi:uncharacterized protein YndB with AHSA1/START domain
MERKTKIKAEDGKQEMVITREFDLPLELLFQAHVDPEILEQWMTSKVIKLESKKNGSYQLEKTDDKGNVLFQANGVIHEFIPNQKIIRTFEMANTPFGVQLEIYEFEKLTVDSSRLNMHVIYESVAQRDEVLKLPFAQGLNWAHNRLQEIANNLK